MSGSNWRLTSDGEFTLAGPSALIEKWLPIPRSAGPMGRAALAVSPSLIRVVPPLRPPLLRLLDVAAWVDADRLILRSPAADGVVDLTSLRGEIGSEGNAFLEPLLTVAAALMLGRLGRALVHAACVVAPNGGAWLLAGDTHAGKSTTLATLVRAGWRWLADDQAIIRATDAGVVVEGWPRPVNLDTGYATGSVTGARTATTDDLLGPPDGGEWPVAGVLLLSVNAERATEVRPASSADAFAALVRQSPWLLADAAAAPAISGLLAATAARPAGSIRLGRDTYGDPVSLLAALDPLIHHR